MAHILLLTHYSHGDILPFTRIGRALTNRGHNVLLASHFHYESLAIEAGLSFAPIDTPSEFETMEYQMRVVASSEDPVKAGLDYYRQIDYVGRVFKEYTILKKLFRPGETVIMARFETGLAALMLAEETSAPFVWLATSPYFLNSASLFEKVVFPMMQPDLQVIRNQIGLPPVDSYSKWVDGADYCIGAWPDWFAQPRLAWPSSTELTGFILDEKEDLKPVLDLPALASLGQDADTLLVVGSTGMFQRSGFYEACIEACRLIGCKSLVVSQRELTLFSDLPPNVSVFRHLPLTRVMSRVKAVIHHGGIGVLAESMRAGVPQIILAAGADRPDNAYRARKLGIAEFLPPFKWKAEYIVDAFRSVTQPTSIERCEQVAGRIAGQDALTSVCTRIDELAENYGI